MGEGCGTYVGAEKGGGGAHRILIRKSGEKKPISRRMSRWEDKNTTTLEGKE
jgi:hypothetical protein